jgi:glutamyl-tRNA synthetase
MGHLSLISGSDGEGLSKRLGSLTLGELREDGIESNALASLLARLGTSEPIVAFKTMEEIIKSFDLSKFSRNTAKFDVNELNLINKKSIQLLDYNDAKEKLNSLGLDASKEFWDLVSGNLDNLKQSIIWWKVIYGEIVPIIDNPEIIKIAKENFPNDKLDNSTWGIWSKKISNESGLKGKELFTTLRKAITSQEHGPELSKLLPVLGKGKILSRLSGIKS